MRSWQPSTENRSVTSCFIALPVFYFNHGRGQLDLAVSILADYFGENPTKEQLFYGDCQCCPAHEDFKQNFLDVQHGDSFTISEEEIKLWLAQRAKDSSSSN